MAHLPKQMDLYFADIKFLMTKRRLHGCAARRRSRPMALMLTTGPAAVAGRNRSSRRRRRRVRGRRVERQSYRQHRSTTVKRPASTAFACTRDQNVRVCVFACTACSRARECMYLHVCVRARARELQLYCVLCIVQLVITLLIVRHSRRGRNVWKNVTHADHNSRNGREASARWSDATDGRRARVACGTYS